MSKFQVRFIKYNKNIALQCLCCKFIKIHHDLMKRISNEKAARFMQPIFNGILRPNN